MNQRSILCVIYFTLCWWFLLLTLSQPAAGLFALPRKDEVLEWANHLHSNITSYVEDVSGIKSLEESIGRKLDDKDIEAVPLNGTALVHKMAEDLSKMLGKKVKALEELVKQAETFVMKHKYEADLPIEQVSFVKMADFTDDDPRLKYDKKFRKGVNFNYSGVHIPIEIYEGYPEITNGLKWSKNLDAVFEANLKRDPDLLWQYFGSEAGFMRTYPANKWMVIDGQPDLYDVRRRPWYIHGSSSPKDMLILLDTSGSMHGQTMEIMKIAVKTLLNTLGENDFVNIAWFSNEAKWVSCFETFVQATRLNKREFAKGINELSDGNMANLSLGLEFSFKKFEEFNRNKPPWAGANCHQIIMLFTDGGTEEPYAVLKTYNRYKRIQIFVYAVGPHPIPVAIVKKVACDNRGYFTTIGSMGAIRTKVQEYVKVLSRPMVSHNFKEIQWTNFYMDAMGLGMMTTVTLPVFNKTKTGDKQSIVGVMGIDVTLQEMMDMAPLYEVGPAGYAFAINPNGFVVFHPDLPTPENYLDDPPQIDFLDVETADSELLQVRNAMIDRQTSYIDVESLIKLPDERHMVHYTMKYFYTPIEKTSYSLAIVFPHEREHYLKIQGMETKNGLGLENDEREGILIAPWKYCKDAKFKGNMHDMINYLSSTIKEKYRRCDKNLVQRLLWDIEATRNLNQYWRNYWRETSKKTAERKDVITRFVMTEGGLIRVYPPSETVHMAKHSDPRKTVFYERAIYAKNFVYIPPLPKDGIEFMQNISDLQNGTRDIAITAVRPALVKNFRPAVIGVQLDPSVFYNYLTSVASSKRKKLHRCNDPDHTLCYLIDDGGFIVTSNQENYWQNVGKFLGVVDPEMMQELWQRKIFERFTEYNFEAQCPREKKVNSSPRTAKFFLLDMVQALSFRWWLDAAACLYSSLLWQESYAVPEFALAPSDKRQCTTLMARYYLGNDTTGVVQEQIQCNNCTRPYSLTSLGDSNLLLIVSSQPCAGSIHCEAIPALLQTPREDEGPDLCQQTLRYRKQPGCAKDSPHQKSGDCGAASDMPRPSALTSFLLCLLACSLMFSSS